jgi:SAM-dependent methyltransferase
MVLGFENVYKDSKRAEAYSKLEFPGTYYLAFRDLLAIIAQYVDGKEALYFGCGSGRSTRFLGRLGFKAIGIDIAAEMVRRAREIDPEGDYCVIKEGDFS